MMNLRTNTIEPELPTFNVASPAPKVVCVSQMADALPAHHAVLRRIERDLCPRSRCNDVDRAILGASLGG